MVRSAMTIAGGQEFSASLRSLERTLASLLFLLLPISLPLPVPGGRPTDVGAPHLWRGIGICVRRVSCSRQCETGGVLKMSVGEEETTMTVRRPG